ncbi:ATP-dependent zinc metalloprotease FTSH, putative [Plasmodium knowlesi strain H]|uniref:ATP-dependent zinc metalloprotease FTSH, putative n=3 Tax=Plasmodium knowlesi TaxID=5850 RepID=A0A5K1V3G2_PLAKH|nr:ATP-dependent zinc metalloprotease FTSH, putative [Plasmodium knowlesi strain H]OTN65129.1 putative ATP-dependent zinc metalloprotease FTSH [Plasmodium knowlesi]CAA9988220.1 ATP-dependent zinc metalloprotease FTSH, putative [Plasmodium knowlesi strain H]SBO20146.1 ATP-dependent zinc metalloprotease FTSH, putative [Plasmodium knowlesi strain H]SBO20565.1 ATP-dependent zinc metalloprotease FTSH, putative [Plasmodium knowlesi strain H]VVS77694.1 ATP-dependent zinc metalloprotease FTSH, putativ|eukprot:XP_002259197.1 ATPase, putative [Plasmodium knowlesi strain H]
MSRSQIFLKSTRDIYNNGMMGRAGPVEQFLSCRKYLGMLLNVPPHIGGSMEVSASEIGMFSGNRRGVRRWLHVLKRYMKICCREGVLKKEELPKLHETARRLLQTKGRGAVFPQEGKAPDEHLTKEDVPLAYHNEGNFPGGDWRKGKSWQNPFLAQSEFFNPRKYEKVAIGLQENRRKFHQMVQMYLSKAPKGFENFERTNKKKEEGSPSSNSFKPDEEKNNKKFDNFFFFFFFMLLLFFFLFVDSNGLYNEVTQNDFFMNYLSKGYVEKIKLVNKDYVKAYLNVHGMSKYHQKYVSFRIGNSDAFERKVEHIQREMNIQREEIIEVQYTNETNMLSEVKGYIPTILFFLLFAFIFQKITLKNVANSGMDRLFKMNKMNPINKHQLKTDVKFSNVAGMKQAKEEIMEFVDFLRAPSKYENLGAKMPKGALLCGAPGTGKTLLAKAVAGEANVPFFNISGSDFIEVFVGIGPSRVRELFAQARKHAPSIIFIDEIDAVGRKRSKGGFAGGGNDERENTLNQMLVEMDGFHTSNDKVVVLAGTNRVDILDPAITRPGRFDRIVHISKPDINERSEIFQVHLKNLKLHHTLDIENISYLLASLTPGFVGADIANVVNEGAIQCARRSNMVGVQVKDFELAIERVIGGLPKSSSLISPLEKKIISYHETGHALIGWLLEHADPVLKVSILPRSNGALGYSQHLSEEVMLFSRDAILDKVAVILGGRAAEELFIGKITTGAIDDLNKVTQLSYSYVSQYGMNKEIGLVSFQPNTSSEYSFYRPHSECLAHLIDNEVRCLIETQYNRVKSILLKHEKQVHKLADLLFQKETISYQDIVECIGERPYPVKSTYEKFVKANPYKLIRPGETPSEQAIVSDGVGPDGGNGVATAGVSPNGESEKGIQGTHAMPQMGEPNEASAEPLVKREERHITGKKETSEENSDDGKKNNKVSHVGTTR